MGLLKKIGKGLALGAPIAGAAYLLGRKKGKKKASKKLDQLQNSIFDPQHTRKITHRRTITRNMGINPMLQMNPHMAQMNPFMDQMNPYMAQMNPFENPFAYPMMNNNFMMSNTNAMASRISFMGGPLYA